MDKPITTPDKDLESQLPAELLLAEERRRNPRPAPAALNQLADVVHAPSLDGSLHDIIMRYAPLVALMAAIGAAIPVLTLMAGINTDVSPAYVMGQVATTLAFTLAFIWLAERSRFGLFAAGVGLVIQTAGAMAASPGAMAASVFELVIGLVILFSIQSSYGQD